MSIDPTLTPQANLLLVEHREQRTRERRRTFLNRLGAAGVVVAIIAALFAIPTAKVDSVTQEKDARTNQLATVSEVADTTSDKNIELCLRGNAAAKEMEQAGLCELAKQLKQAVIAAAPSATPGAQGKQGEQGEHGIAGSSGRGIASTAIVAGHFQVTYTDGTTEDKGVITGSPGAAGRGITGSTVNNGRLVLVYSDGKSEDVGQVVGKDGQNGQNGTDGVPGKDGAPGRGITSITTDAGHLIVTYTDGTTTDLGPLPQGPQGNDGKPPLSWVVHNPDGSTTNCQRSQSFDFQNPTYDCTRTAASPAGLLGGGR
jgi:hypothetical protein